MHTATLLSFQDELEKLAGLMEDAHADYMGMMKQHMHNPQVVSRLHPTERMAVFKHLNSPKNAGLGGKIVAKAGKAVSTFAKAAGLGAGALDLAGLGMLAAPTVQKMRGKPMSEKNTHRAELGGLGVLGGSVVAEHAGDIARAGRSGLSKLKGLASKAPKQLALKFAAAKVKKAAPSMSAMMNMHRLADAAKAAKPAAGALAGAGKALTNPGNMGRAAHLAQNVATGGHAWNPAAAAKRAISL